MKAANVLEVQTVFSLPQDILKSTSNYPPNLDIFNELTR